MRKILSLLMMMVFSVSMFAATKTTVYYTAPAATIGTYTVKLNTNQQTNPDSWFTYTMTKTDLSYNGDPVYTASFTDLWDGVDKMQFQLYDGSTWKSQKQPFSSWAAASTYNGKMFVHATEKWVDPPTSGGGDTPEPTFPVMQIAGIWTEWTAKDFTVAKDSLTATYTATLAIGEYEFKVLKDNKWLTKANNGEPYALHRGWPGVSGVKDDATVNIKLIADAAGTYTFTWTYANDSIGITFPDAPVVIPAKYYITGDSALVGKDLAWNPAALKSEKDTMVLDLKAGDYKLKLTLDGTWTDGKVNGYDELTVKSEGLSGDADNNITFKLAEAGKVTVVYISTKDTTIFKVEGNFYVKPVVKKTLKLVPGVWAEANAKIAAWLWGKDLDAQFTSFFAGKDTLTAEINAAADSIAFVRFADKVEAPTWADEDKNVWNKMSGDTIDYVGLTYTITDWAKGQWTVYVPEVPAKYYITGDSALVGKDLAWNPAALKSEKDTMVLDLKAGDYKLKLTLDGTWTDGKVKGYDELTVKSEGLSGDADNNITFKLAEAGKVTVVYNDSVFTLDGKFYVKPAPEPTFPVMEIAGAWDVKEEAWVRHELVVANDSLTATYTVSLEAGSYEFKMIKDNKWLTKANNGEAYGLHREWAGVSGVTDEATENLKLTADVAGTYTFTWTYANDSVGITFPEKSEPVLTDGFYLVGSMNEWTPAAQYLFKANPDAEGEYSLDITFAEGDDFKVVYVENDVKKDWYPGDGTDNYLIDADHTGTKTVYFRPDYQGGEDWYYHCIFVAANGGTGVEETMAAGKAAKVLRNGHFFILKGDKIYNVTGAVIR